MELVIVAGITGIIGCVVAVLLGQGLKLWFLNRAQTNIQQQGRTVLSLITRDVRQGQASTFVIDRYASNQPPYSRLTFTTISGRNISYYQNNTKLFMTADGKTTTISSQLRTIMFAYLRTDNDNILNISLITEQATYEGAAKALQLSIEKVRVMND